MRSRFLLSGIIIVIALWDTFTSSGDFIDGSGINRSIFWLGIIALSIVYRAPTRRDALYHIAPLILIALSIGFYETSFTTAISIAALPLLVIFSTTISAWRSITPICTLQNMLMTVARYALSFLQAPRALIMAMPRTAHMHTVGVIALGALLLSLLAGGVIIPPLASADEQLATLAKHLVQIFLRIDLLHILNVLFTVVLLVALIIHWKDIQKWHCTVPPSGRDGNIIASILLGGLLLVYVVFLTLQVQTLFITGLPQNFTDVLRIVKGGFWQLVTVTIINGILILIIFDRVTVFVRRIAALFTIASLLLGVSALWRMMLYIHYYGLSFEKFFAFYATIFFVGALLYIVIALLRAQRIPIVPTLMTAALWMYAVATILPLERIIYTYNLTRTQDPMSRIDINEMRMLGYDALPLIDETWDTLLVLAEQDLQYYDNDDTETRKDVAEKYWSDWRTNVIANTTLRTYGKGTLYKTPQQWYERSMTSLIYKVPMSPSSEDTTQP